MKEIVKNNMPTIFEVLRIVPITAENQSSVSDTDLAAALTLNENLKTLGYTLTPAGIIQIAKSPDRNSFYDKMRSLIGDVKTPPMYPDFPTQVMKLSEAEFRFHQMVHYFSTYGMEALFGIEVPQGWLPPVEETAKTEPDKTLLDAKAIELIDESQISMEILTRILSKRERMTNKEKVLVSAFVGEALPEDLAQLNIPFKQNMLDVFHAILMSGSKYTQELLHNICKHCGDVLKCMDYSLTRCHYHFKTSQKRLLTKLLESYTVVDFKSNLVLSMRKAKRSKLMLDYIDFETYSRSVEHKQAARQLRSGELRSWESKVKYLLASGNDGALDFIAQRPGMLLRMTAWLLRLGYCGEEIVDRLSTKEAATSLSMQTIITLLTIFSKDDMECKNRDALVCIFMSVLCAKLNYMDIPLRNKKVFFKLDNIAPEATEILCNNKSADGGYIPSGTAFRIPREVKYLRMFVYWNDRHRVDVDLHSFGLTKQGDTIHCGWNGDFRNGGLVHSGDITHSDAAEYIDVDMSNPDLETVFNDISLYDGKECFKDIDECFVGMMAVDSIGCETKLYNPANCFFTHHLQSKERYIDYGYIDVPNRLLVFTGTEVNRHGPHIPARSAFTLKAYLDILVRTQNIQAVYSEDEADVVLVFGKANGPKEISLIDENFFMDAPAQT